MERIQLSQPSFTREEIAAAERVLRSGRLVSGPEAVAFEEELAAACGRRHAAVVSSGTAALHLTLHCLWPEGSGQLLVPAFTFPATANVAAFLPARLTVCLCDVDPDSFCAPAGALERHLAARVGPAVQVHQFGYPAPLPPQGQLVLSDAACAIGAPGALQGRAACLSFHPRKLLTTGEGGAVLSDDEALVAQVRALRSHGLVPQPGQQVLAEPTPGLNYRMPEVAAAIGRVQLRRLPQILAVHAELALRYRERLAGQVGLQADAPGRVWQTLAVVLPPGTDRAALRRALSEEGIETQIASYGLHRLAAFAGAPLLREDGTVGPGVPPVADALHDRGLALPLHAGLRLADVDRVCEVLLRLLNRPPARLSGPRNEVEPCLEDKK
ncbi:MAG: DegT/DnrJ/EryC1/StrS family aminotransferase [Myxococcales bacterium]|nr:DegT/DnrJ/EryC1/StrS family aminotransferase [Myxococcota bacterium]MDW8280554.1 DegT/DnrJ/EryC1/StrS family aminotransferase [Myxococcales bacterium]